MVYCCSLAVPYYSTVTLTYSLFYLFRANKVIDVCLPENLRDDLNMPKLLITDFEKLLFEYVNAAVIEENLEAATNKLQVV